MGGICSQGSGSGGLNQEGGQRMLGGGALPPLCPEFPPGSKSAGTCPQLEGCSVCFDGAWLL